MPIIYRKTARGLAEVETRVYKLSPRLRSVLIMIDGKRSDVDILQLLPHAGDALAALVQEDFIAEFTRTAPLPPAPAVGAAAPAAASGRAPAAAAPETPERTIIRGQQPSFETMRRDLLGAFNERLGPAGEGMAVRLAQARNETEFRALLPGAVQLIAALRGREAAESFMARINAW